MTLKELCEKAYAAAKANGWYDVPEGQQPPTFGDRIALCHSELSEALEAYRDRGDNGYTVGPLDAYYRTPTTGRVTMIPKTEYIAMGEIGYSLNKPEGVPAELADVVIRIADMCGFYGIDLQKAVEEKMEYNATRSYRHGNKRL